MSGGAATAPPGAGRAQPHLTPPHTSLLCSPTMIKYGINNIRELVGHRVNLQMVYDSPLCRLDT